MRVQAKSTHCLCWGHHNECVTTSPHVRHWWTFLLVPKELKLGDFIFLCSI